MGLPFLCYKLLQKTQLLQGLANERGSCEALMLGRAKMSFSERQRRHIVAHDHLDEHLVSGYADEFLKASGCSVVDTLDYADFEGASVVWNLNKQITKHKKLGSYDVILDYGTSEHVFSPAMTFYNSLALLKDDGWLNCLLPVCGLGDHALYHFSPSWFYALESEAVALHKLYFAIYDRDAAKVTFWDGLSEDFREHVHGAFDGSFAGSCLEYLNKPILAWALYHKRAPVSAETVLHETQQLVYKEMWKGTHRRRLTRRQEAKLAIFQSPKSVRIAKLREYLNGLSETL